VNHPYGSAFGAYTVGRLHLARGAVDLAIPILEQALERVERRSIVLNRPLTLSWLGYAYVLAGRVETGLPLLSAAVAQAAEIRRYEWGPLVGRLAEALLVAGRIDEALERGREALALAQAQEERGHEAWVLALLGRIHADQSPRHTPRRSGCTAARSSWRRGWGCGHSFAGARRGSRG
jgi:tetratricopeptide (TPR) repeat protein